MKFTQKQRLLSHGILGLILVFSFTYGIRQMFVTEYVEVCSARYNTMTSYPKLETDTGEARRQINRDELAAMFGLGSWGVIENARVEAARGLDERYVIEVGFPYGSFGPRAKRAPKGGMSFRWRHGRPQPITSACLSYGLYLSPNFPYHDGGKLPGLFGRGKPKAAAETASATPSGSVVPSATAPVTDGFSTRPGWIANGVTGIAGFAPQPAQSGSLAFNQGGWVLPLGRWINVEQEVVLNTPGMANGILRVWVDKELLVDNREMEFRKSNDVLIDGIMGDVFYDAEVDNAAPATTVVRLTPFQLRWN